jgi:DNA-binding NtrC family response regulator
LAIYFTKKFSELNHVEEMTLSSTAMQALIQHQWSGNVRELQNTIPRVVLLSSSKMIEIADLFDSSTMMAKSVDVSTTLDRQLMIGTTIASMERELIFGTLDHCEGNKTHAANILGISIRTLRNKLHEYELQTSLGNNEMKYGM